MTRLVLTKRYRTRRAHLSLKFSVGLMVFLAAAFVSSLALGQQHAPEAAAQPSGGPVPGTTYIIDPSHTFVIYEVGHYGTTTNRGRFSTSDGFVKINGDGKSGTVDISMDMTSMNTGVDLLNRHLQSKDFFDVADYPSGRFVADQINFTGDKVEKVSGSLTLLGKTVPVTLQADRFNCYVSPQYNKQVCGGDFETTITRSDFGIKWGLEVGFEDKVHLIIQIEAIEDK